MARASDKARVRWGADRQKRIDKRKADKACEQAVRRMFILEAGRAKRLHLQRKRKDERA
jgi:hypothetical protein